MRTETITQEIASAIGMVGRVVTVGSAQYKIHSVEGTDWYAFDDQGQTTVDFHMTPASWITFPLATIIPSGHKIGGYAVPVDPTAERKMSGHKIGDGFSTVVALDQCRPGVCLAKSYV